MKQLVCIGCPRGCRLTVEEKDGEYIVTGNTCPRGKAFAISEMTAPKRTICSTVKTVFAGCPVLPVRVSDDIPKEKIFDVMREINAVTLRERIGRGDVVIENVLGLGVDVISTSDLLKQNINAVSEGAK
jgi:CxxC motif-containing protein